MKGSDLFLAFIIILIFVALYFFNMIALGMKNIQENWPKYRCNPIMMPFAGSFGQDPMENFTFCIQNMQKNLMGYLLEPINYSLSSANSIGSEFMSSINNVRKMFAAVRDFITNIIKSVFGVFLNILIEIQKMIIGLKDTMGKTIGIATTMMFLMDGTVKTMQSAWNGPPGQLTRALCFRPDTKLRLENGDIVNMKDINLGDILKNGSEVIAVLKINNKNKNGTLREPLYKLPNGESEPLYVTGNHLIMINGKFGYVKNHPQAELCTIESDTLSCLITSDNKICIGKYVFWDYDDDLCPPEMTDI
jgi:hypothetical protein